MDKAVPAVLSGSKTCGKVSVHAPHLWVLPKMVKPWYCPGIVEVQLPEEVE